MLHFLVNPFSLTRRRDMGQLLTGATNGIGLVAARELARRGAHVVLVGRSRARCATATAQIQAQTGNRQAEALLADLSSQQQVRDLAKQFRDRHPRLDVLVNNAGGIWLRRETTADGLEMTIAVNHLAYSLLTYLLLDLLKASVPARIVNVSSAAHRKATLDFDDLMGDRGYDGWQQYCRSKLMNLLFTYELARKLEGTGVTANALHPGWVPTGFAANNGWKGRLWQFVARWFALNVEEGARTIIYLASSPEVAGVSGRYFVRERVVLSSTASTDETAAHRLWQISQKLTHVAPVSP
jgi:NAD(P)-dependent dehydrogenase (short-subunit alcohol dehydrogenase family)